MALKFSKIYWLCCTQLLISALFILLFVPIFSRSLYISDFAFSQAKISSLHFDFSLLSEFSMPSISETKEKIHFFKEPQRPELVSNSSNIFIQLKESKETIRLASPSQIYFEYNDAGSLSISQDRSLFSLSCSLLSENSVQAVLKNQKADGNTIEEVRWNIVAQEPPFRSVDEFLEGSPFRELSEARWLGRDLLYDYHKGGSVTHRLEVGPIGKAGLIDCSMNDWLAFKDGKWQKSPVPEESKGIPIAHLKMYSSQSLEIEGWEGDTYARFKLKPTISAPLKVRMDEFFSQFRIRSEKQVSCSIDKQSFVLHTGDWMLKTGQKWKVLRKAEEKEAVLNGQNIGEIFIFERIEIKNGSKFAVGHYFAANHCQMISLENFPKETIQRQSKNRSKSR